MIDTDKYEPTRIDTLLHNTRAHRTNGWRELSKSLIELSDDDRLLIEYAPLLLQEVKRLRGLLDEINDVVYYNDKKAGQVLPVEKPNLELLRDIMMSYTDEAYQIRGDEGGWIE